MYNGTPYYFVKNLQGDVIAITDVNANVVVKYRYDAWGKPTTVSDTSGVSLGYYNPFRYRGYYYDVETGLYYLQSRYYDANVGRFINGDDAVISILPISLLNHNMFAYCENNAVNKLDYCGYTSLRLNNLYNAIKDAITKTKSNLDKTIASVMRTFSVISRNLSPKWRNYLNNKRYIFVDLINDQKCSPFDKMYYGSETMNKNGCGPIAIYNMHILANKGWKSMADVVYELESCSATILNGKFGTDPKKLAKYFKQNNISYEKITKIDELEELGKNGRVFIMTYWRNKNNIADGAHTIAVTCDSENTRIAYNNGVAKKANSFDLLMKSSKKKGKGTTSIYGKLIMAYYIK